MRAARRCDRQRLRSPTLAPALRALGCGPDSIGLLGPPKICASTRLGADAHGEGWVCVAHPLPAGEARSQRSVCALTYVAGMHTTGLQALPVACTLTHAAPLCPRAHVSSRPMQSSSVSRPRCASAPVTCRRQGQCIAMSSRGAWEQGRSRCTADRWQRISAPSCLSWASAARGLNYPWIAPSPAAASAPAAAHP